MKLIISIFLLTFCVINLSYSQTDSLALKKVYEKDVIYLSGKKYIKNNNLYPLYNLKSEFKENSEGLLVYQMYENDFGVSRVFSTIGTIGFIASYFVGQRNPNAGYATLIASGLAITISQPYSARAKKRINKAVWLRNRDVLTSGGY